MNFARHKLSTLFPMNFSKRIDYIRSDYYRFRGGQCSVLKMFIATFSDVGFRFMFWFRLSQADGLFSYFPRLVLFHLRIKHKISIERCTKIGYGFRIGHNGPVVINSSAVIGNNVTMLQGCTIGSLNCTAAHIGDNVYIGPNVCIVENVTIGNNVTIGAGAIVVKDVPEDVTIAGNPARVVSHKTPGRFIWNRWDCSWNKAE